MSGALGRILIPSRTVRGIAFGGLHAGRNEEGREKDDGIKDGA